MSILIKGMEMPQKKYGYVLVIYPDGKVHCQDGEEYQAVPVPPHGRCIDADAAIADIRGEILEHQMNRMKGTPFYIEDLRMMWQRLEDEEFIPTVISAEQEEEKRNE